MRKLALIIFLMMLVGAWSVPKAVHKTPLVATDVWPTLALLGVFPDYVAQTIVEKDVAQAATDVASVVEMEVAVVKPKPQMTFSQAMVVADTVSTPAVAVNAVQMDADFETALALEDAPPEIRITWMEEGEFIDLERESPEEIELGQHMKFVATLVNRTDSKLNLVAEVLIRKGDGSLETLIPNYNLQLGKGKQFRVPVGMPAKERRFPPGLTQFVALLRDKQGQLIDQAQITFKLTLPL